MVNNSTGDVNICQLVVPGGAGGSPVGECKDLGVVQ